MPRNVTRTERGSALLWSALIFSALMVLLVMTVFKPRPPATMDGRRGSAVPISVAAATDRGRCIECHARSSPGIVHQHSMSAHAQAGISCLDCHEVQSDHFAATMHYDHWISDTPTSAMCSACHQAETEQFLRSRHSLPAYVAMVGAQNLSPEMKEMYDSIEEITNIDTDRNALFHMEGPEITRFACQGCHDIGMPYPDGSVGTCTDCHLRHEFSIEQARKPETCSACHIGPDHPQWEIYQESPHGIAYQVSGDDWNWHAEAGTQTVQDIPAATCAVCHMSGFGATGTTHDVGERLTWFLFQPVSERRPGWRENASRMQQVCRECHSSSFTDEFYTDADALVEAVNDWVNEGQAIYDELTEAGHTTPEPFDDPVDFVMFDLWHHWGRTAKFGAWMQGPDYTQWHGAYEMLRELAELRHIRNELLGEEEEASDAEPIAAAEK